MQLSKGFVAACNNGTYQTDPQFKLPVVQILNTKTFETPQPGPDRYRALVSDGDFFMWGMMATQLNGLMSDGTITKNTILRVKRYVINTANNKPVMIIMDVEVLTPNQKIDKIGNPVHYDSVKGGAPSASVPQSSATASSASSAQPKPAEAQAFYGNQQAPRPAAPQPVARSAPATPSNYQQQPQAQFSPGQPIAKIASLSPYNPKWTILARVLSKSDIRTWQKEKSEGKLFSVVFSDESGEIKATGFNDAVDTWYSTLTVGQVYYVSKAQIKPAKRQYSKVDNDYEITLASDTNIQLCMDAAAAPQVKYNRIPLADLANREKDATVDIIGVVHEVSDISTIMSRNTNRELTKRELVIVDESAFKCKLTLWGRDAQEFDYPVNPVIALKGVKVGDYGGRTLSYTSTSSMAVNPDIKEAHVVKGWYNSYIAKDGEFQSFENMAQPTGAVKRDNYKFASQVKDDRLGMGDKPDYFMYKGNIVYIKSDSLYYPACPTEGCNKKVVEDGYGWRCEKCNQSFNGPVYRYIMSLAVADHTGQIRLQAFNEIGEQVFGMSASELERLSTQDEAQFKKVLAKVNYSQGIFKVRAKSETYNDEARVRCNVVSYEPMDYAQDCRDLLERIERYRM